jgi:hypothetical protein
MFANRHQFLENQQTSIATLSCKHAPKVPVFTPVRPPLKPKQ